MYASFRLPAHLLSNPVNKLATSQNYKEYIITDLESWNILKGGAARRIIELVPYTADGSKEFTVKSTDKEVHAVMDNNGDIRFSKVMEFCLSRFDTNGGVLDLWEW